jgi:hypothetical protein
MTMSTEQIAPIPRADTLRETMTPLFATASREQLTMVRELTEQATARIAAEFSARFRNVPVNAIWHGLEALGAGDWRTYPLGQIAYHWAKRSNGLASLSLDQIEEAARAARPLPNGKATV